MITVDRSVVKYNLCPHKEEKEVCTFIVLGALGTSSLFDEPGNEDDDLSDLEVDPVSITPPDSPAQAHMLSSENGSLPVKDIISAIPGNNFPPHEL